MKVGVLGVRLYRPFPDEAIAEALKDATGVIVIEKALSYGYEGALVPTSRRRSTSASRTKATRPS